MIDPKDLAEEQSKMRILKAIVDLTAAILRQGNLTTMEAIELMKATKRGVLHLFPDKEETCEEVSGIVFYPQTHPPEWDG